MFAEQQAEFPERKIKFEVKEREDGRRALFFPYMTFSDIHWGTQYARAKRLSRVFDMTWANEVDFIGDIWDGVEVQEKKKWNVGPYHRQGIGYLFRKASDGETVRVFEGNHEYGINRYIHHDGHKKKHRWVEGKSIYGVDFVRQQNRTDPLGRKISREHGHEYDNEIFKSEASRGFWYKLGDRANMALYSSDRAVRHVPGLKHFSLAATAKKAVKVVINDFMGVNKAITQALDKSDHDIVIYGHSHMPGFMWTSNGNLAVNDGCCTEHVNSLVQDENGRMAILTWHEDHIEVEEEPMISPVVGEIKRRKNYIRNFERSMDETTSSDMHHLYWQAKAELAEMEAKLPEFQKRYLEGDETTDPRLSESVKYKLRYKDDLGLDDEFLPKARLIEDEYTAKADNMLRVLYRMWPSKDRVKAHEDIKRYEARIREYEKNAQVPGGTWLGQYVFYKAAKEKLPALRKDFLKVPIPRTSVAEMEAQPTVELLG